MAGCSIVFITMLFAWPIVLMMVVGFLAFEAAALVVTSPAFPPLLIAMATGALGCLAVALSLWRHVKDPEGHPLALPSFRWAFIFFGVSFVAICAAIALAGVQVVGFLSSL